jgi:hypothetical protein
MEEREDVDRQAGQRRHEVRDRLEVVEAKTYLGAPRYLVSGLDGHSISPPHTPGKRLSVPRQDSR